MNPDLRTRLKAAYAKVKNFPEQSFNPDGSVTIKGSAWMAMLDLRALVPELDNALWELEQTQGPVVGWGDNIPPEFQA
jgi:hypothetical protein